MLLNTWTSRKDIRSHLAIIVIIVAVNLLLSILAVISSNTFPLREGIGDSIMPNYFPHVWSRWDSGYYVSISQNGYRLGGAELAFLPLFPISMRIVSSLSSLDFVWSGYLIAVASSVLAIWLFWIQAFRDCGMKIATNAAISMTLFPTSFFFTAVYTEGLFLLLSVLVYWFSMRNQYYTAAIFVALASVTRVGGILLCLIPLIECSLIRKHIEPIRSSIILMLSSTGLAFYAVYLWMTVGSPIAFLIAQKNWDRELVFPWQTFVDSSLVVLGVKGDQNDWFMRMISFRT